MLRVADRPLAEVAGKTLAKIQAIIDDKPDYPARVAAAKAEWGTKTSTTAKKEAFKAVRDTLAQMCVGSVRCAYCEDSLADEVEHIQPKNLFPDVAFKWPNYLFACGPCNGPKSNRYGIVNGQLIDEFVRKRGDPIVAPGAGASAFINPRTEDPFDFLELDLGGTTPDGAIIAGTFELLPRLDLKASDLARADFTIEVLGLNREVIRAARENAFGGFRARMREYAEEKEAGATPARLGELRDDLLKTPHLSVFADMRRQRAFVPELADLFQRATEMLVWEVVPSAVQQ